MKIVSLDLLAFGAFTKLHVDLSGPPLVLVYGPNAGGKSTARTAIENALFGINETTTYGFLHPLDKLRIGLSLEDGQGPPLDLVRRKGRQRTLAHPDQSSWTQTDDERLRLLCLGMDPTVFETLFGLDHDRLRAGAQDLLRSRGELGESLLGAETGVSVGRLVKELAAAADDLWAPRGQKYPLNTALRIYREAHQALKRAAVQPQTWLDADAKVADLAAQRTAQEGERRATEARRRELDRLQGALPVLQARDRAVAERDSLPVGPSFSLEELAMFEAASVSHQEAMLKADAARAALDDLGGRLEQLSLDESLLARAAEIRALEHDLGGYRHERDDQPQRQRERDLKVAEALDRLHPYWPGLTLDRLREELAIPAPERTALERLTDEPAHFQTTREEIRGDEARLERQGRKWMATLKELGPARDLSGLQAVLEATRRDGALERELESTSARLTWLRDTLTPALARLGCAGRAPTAVAALVFPTRDAVSAWLGEHQAYAQRAAADAEAEAEWTAKGAAAERDLRALELVRSVPAPADLDVARDERAAAWEALKRAWASGPPPTETVAAYELAMTRVDSLAEALWREAERIAQHAQLVADLEEVERERVRLREQAEAGSEARAGADRAWAELWAPPSLPAPAPTEALAALDAHAGVVERAAETAEAEGRVRTLTGTRDRHVAALRAALASHSVPIPDRATTFAALQDVAADAVAKAAKSEGRQREAQAGIDSQGDAEEALEGRRTALGNRETKWQAAWAAALGRLKLATTTSVETLATALHELGEATATVASVAELEHRILRMAEDCAAFATRAQDLAQALASDLAPVAPDELARQLGERLRSQEARQAKRQALSHDVTTQTTTFQTATLEAESAAATLFGLAATVGVGDLNQLEVAVALDRKRRELTEQIGAQERDLEGRGTGWMVAEYLERRAHTDPDTLADQIGAFDENLETQGQALNRTIAELTLAQGMLHDLSAGGSTAAEAAEAQQAAAAEIAELARRYARLQLAAALLRITMQHHRDAHQAWVVERAGSLFQTLTAGTFQGLDVSEDPGAAPVIVAVRAGGDRASTLDQISDGERDQLFLALRLASVERHCTTGGPMPIILDDVLVNFDDDRTAAALRVLVELSQLTQVLVFTHHQRVLELARAVLPADSFGVVTLIEPGGAPTG